jgi:hypothetical protein
MGPILPQEPERRGLHDETRRRIVPPRIAKNTAPEDHA